MEEKVKRTTLKPSKPKRVIRGPSFSPRPAHEMKNSSPKIVLEAKQYNRLKKMHSDFRRLGKFDLEEPKLTKKKKRRAC